MRAKHQVFGVSWPRAGAARLGPPSPRDAEKLRGQHVLRKEALPCPALQCASVSPSPKKPRDSVEGPETARVGGTG